MALNIRQAASATRNRGKQWQVAADIKLTNDQYQSLLRHCTARLDIAKAARDRHIEIFKHIDREYYSWLKRDADDKKRQRDNSRGIGVKPVDQKLSLLFSQIDEAATYLLSVLAPDEALYSAMASKAKQPIAKAFSALMNQHAQTFGHFRQYALFLIQAMKYNFGAFGVNWMERWGNTLVNSGQTGTPEIKYQVVAAGNEIVTFDPYNLLIDPSIDAVNLPEKGEYFGFTDVTTEFRLMKASADEGLFNVEEYVSGGTAHSLRPYYQDKPYVRNDVTDSTDMRTDWFSLLAFKPESKESAVGFETTTAFFWLIPSKFGLSRSTKYEIWRIMLGADRTILQVKHMDNAHGMLPCNVAVPYEDNFGWQTKGGAERLIPHQQFASFVMNSHQRAVRKRLYGLTFYDAQRMPAMAQDDVDLMGGKIPFNSNGQDVDVNKLVRQFSDGPDTTGTLQNVALIGELMQDIMPTKMQQQVAGLDRATQYQAAAVVQSASRRNLKLAKIIDSQAMQRGRTMQMLNIQQKQESMEILVEGGEPVQINPKDFRDTKLEFEISDGLKGIDRLALIMNIKEVLNSILQSQQASQQIDVVAVINYWTSLLGDNTDFAQFKIISPIDQLPTDQRNLAFQLLQQYAAQQEQAGTQQQPPQ
jgi:hypothetical protein